MIFFSEKAKDNFFKSKACLGVGGEGTCYKINDNITGKILSDLSLSILKKDELLKFKDIEIESFGFIKELIYLRWRIIGYIYPYLPGIDLRRQYLCNMDIIMLCKALEDVISSLEKLSECQIQTDSDIAMRNTLFADGKFYFIDTNGYFYSKMNYQQLFEYNVINVLYMLISAILYHPDFCPNVFNFVCKEKEFQSWPINYAVLSKPTEFLMGIKNKIENIYGQKINTFSEGSRLLRIKK